LPISSYRLEVLEEKETIPQQSALSAGEFSQYPSDLWLQKVELKK
jgi:hypothetical protein